MSTSTEFKFRSWASWRRLFYDLTQKVPGGMMVVPFLLGLILNQFIDFGTGEKNLPNSLFYEGQYTYLAVLMFSLGAQIPFREFIQSFQDGWKLILYKLFIAFFTTYFLLLLFGQKYSPLFYMSFATNPSISLYLVLSQQFGLPKRYWNLSFFVILLGGPFTSLVMSSFFMPMALDYHDYLYTILPTFIGILLGNLDPRWSVFLSPISKAVVPFLAFASALHVPVIQNQGMDMGNLVLLFVVALSVYLAVSFGVYQIFRRIFSVYFAPYILVLPIAGNAIVTPIYYYNLTQIPLDFCMEGIFFLFLMVLTSTVGISYFFQYIYHKKSKEEDSSRKNILGEGV